jgi:methyltransferase (TIGR00027 family)
MQQNQFSRTAWAVAVHRAAHQTLEGGNIFRDPFAHAILGPEADIAIANHSKPERGVLRLFVAVRARFAEDCLAAAVARDVRQLVVLGAGLDTFALRNPYPNLTVFEVDHPATQEWKRQCLNRAGLAVPPCLHFAPVDFEKEKLLDGLAAAGFRTDQPAMFIWLGVVPYLTREAILSTLVTIADVPDGEVVFDYSEPLENYAPEARARAQALAQRAAALGEPWLSQFHPAELTALLRASGFGEIEDLGPTEIGARFFNKLGQPQRAGPHVVRAKRH